MGIELCKIIELPKIHDQRGNLSFIEGIKHIPFEIQRVFWIYDVPGGESRGGHAYKETHEFIVALSGSFDIVLDDGIKEQRFSLNRSYYGLYVPSLTWRRMENFSTNALALVIASTQFNQLDYIRDYNEFIKQQKINLIRTPAELYNLRTKEVLNNLFSLKSTIYDCSEMQLDINHREKGNITVFENNNFNPFVVKRVYYLYDVPGGEERGGHAHKNLKQMIIAASGSFDVVIDDGKSTKTVTLNRPYQCLQIVPGIWRELVNFSSGSICLVLASQEYDELDYIRDYNIFLKIKNA